MSSDNSGIFRSDGGLLMQIVREGQTAPDGNGTFIEIVGAIGSAFNRRLVIGV
jgi:hypothetical protein